MRKCHVRFCSGVRGREAPPYRDLGSELLFVQRLDILFGFVSK